MMKGLNKLLITATAFSAVTLSVLIGASAAPVASGAGTVSCSALNVRSAADTTADITATLSQGATVVILEKEGEWYRVNAGGTSGYVSSAYISDVEAAKNFTAAGTITGSNIRMRSTPSTSGAILGKYQSGTVMNVIGINNGWYKVSCGGKTGYVRSDYLNLTVSGADPASSAAVAASGVETTEGQEIADFARQFTGSKYIYGAASPGRGFDCSGLTYYIYSKFGYSISRTASQQYRNNGATVSKSDLLPGDLVFFSRNGGRSVTHVGLYIGGGNFVNASTERTGVIISSLSSTWYTKTWYGAKRIIG